MESSIVDASNSHSQYSISSSQAKISLKDSTKVTVLYDTDAKINIMTCEVIKDVSLAM